MVKAIKTENFFWVQINYKYEYFHLKEKKNHVVWLINPDI